MKDFTYNDVSRYARNETNQPLETEHCFTEHALDST